jgi:hypothetical protein
MQQNITPLDSTLRVLLGFGLLFVGFIIAPPLKYFAYAGFLIFAISGLVGKCPLYRVLGIRRWQATR